MSYYRFSKGKDINLLESLISLLRRITREVIRTRRLLVLVDSRVVLGAVSKGRSSSRKVNFLLRKLWFWCLAHDVALELEWVPTWANPADAPSRNKPIESWYASLPKRPPPPTAAFASVHARSELDLLREPQHANICGHCSPLVSSAARERDLPVVKMKLRKSTGKCFYAFDCAAIAL